MNLSKWKLPHPENNDLFERVHAQLSLDRIRMASIFLLLLYPYYAYIDFFQFKDVAQTDFRYTLIAVHTSGFLGSLIFLGIHRARKQNRIFTHPKWASKLIIIYSTMYIFSGVVASLNSQRLTGNVDAYVIIVICAAVLIPIRPLHFLIILIGNHAAFLTFLSIVSEDRYSLISKQVNTTVAVAIAFIICFTFYRHRLQEFLAQTKLEKNEEHLRKLFDINPYPLVLLRLKDEKVLAMNSKAMEWFRLGPEGLDTIKQSICNCDEEEKREIINELKQKGGVYNRVMQLTLPADGLPRWVLTNYEHTEVDGEDCALAGITDISELKKAENELIKQATTDALTGTMNRRLGLRKLQADLDSCSEGGTEFILCFADVNELKQVNDHFGHAEGDDLIKAAAAIIESHLDDGDYLFRYGGDEFIAVFHKPLDAAEQIWDRIRQDLDSQTMKPFKISVSHGLFQYKPGMNLSVDQLIEKADHEMYKTKKRRDLQ